MLPSDPFVAGLVAFLLGHVAYVARFLVDRGTVSALIISAAVVLVVDLFNGRPIVVAARRDPRWR